MFPLFVAAEDLVVNDLEVKSKESWTKRSHACQEAVHFTRADASRCLSVDVSLDRQHGVGAASFDQFLPGKFSLVARSRFNELRVEGTLPQRIDELLPRLGDCTAQIVIGWRLVRRAGTLTKLSCNHCLREPVNFILLVMLQYVLCYPLRHVFPLKKKSFYSFFFRTPT